MGLVQVLALMLLMMGDQAPSPAPAEPPPELPVSLERIHEGLQQRPKLKIPPVEITPVFRARVDELLFETPLQGMRRELAADPGGHPGGGVDVLPAIMGIVNGIKRARRARAEREIRREVQAAIDAFCAEHDCSVLENGPTPMEGIILPRKVPAR
jgi:hypothetical protein